MIELSPIEDLYREHGIVSRIVFLLNKTNKQLDSMDKQDAVKILSTSGKILRNLIEDHHEKLEELVIFPCFKNDKKFMKLVKTLTAQHKAGRKTTDKLINAAPESLSGLSEAIEDYCNMYSVHASHENTVLFPAFYKIIKDSDYKKIRDKFEAVEKKLTTENTNLEKSTLEVAKLEQIIDIYRIEDFTI
jgi:hemerythrin-like domain-containing protein